MVGISTLADGTVTMLCFSLWRKMHLITTTVPNSMIIRVTMMATRTMITAMIESGREVELSSVGKVESAAGETKALKK